LSSNNNLANNTVNDNDWGIYLSRYSSNNTLQENEISNNSIGISSDGSDSNINSNFVCDNTNSDFYSSDWLTSSGDNNTCGNADGWNDTSQVSGGCKYPCLPCEDNDGDGYGACPACNVTHNCNYDGNDCDDANLSINPGAQETCNGIDDDCDGLADSDDFDLTPCDDAISCTDDICQVGVCVHTANDSKCPGDDWFNVSTTYNCCNGTQLCTCQDQEYGNYYCNETTGCNYTVTETRTLKSGCFECNDTISCTDDTCSAGVCVHTANDSKCPGDDWFNVSTTYNCCNGTQLCTCQDQEYRNYYCNETTGCNYNTTDTRTVKNNCNDCGSDYYCDNGACTPLGECINDANCSHLNDDCNIGKCNNETEQCYLDPKIEGTACTSDGIECTEDVCQSGVCNHISNESRCLEDAWVDNGSIQWVSTGECTEKQQKGQEYRNYYCDAIFGCEHNVTERQWVDTGETRNKSDGTICDDGLFCTDPDTCSAGVCSGTVRDCSDGITCTDDSCNETNDSCVNTPDNGNCGAGYYCNETSDCKPIGECIVDTNCSALSDQCNTGKCNTTTWTCYADPTPKEGGACDDGLFCTNPDTCSAGVCSGIARNCSDGVTCTDDSCNETNDSCVNTPDNGNCGAGYYCNETSDCQPIGECTADNDCFDNQTCSQENYSCMNLNCPEDRYSFNHQCYHICDINRDGIYINDYNDLMNAYKCFLGIENCNNNYQNWNSMKQEYECFTAIS